MLGRSACSKDKHYCNRNGNFHGRHTMSLANKTEGERERERERPRERHKSVYIEHTHTLTM